MCRLCRTDSRKWHCVLVRKQWQQRTNGNARMWWAHDIFAAQCSMPMWRKHHRKPTTHGMQLDAQKMENKLQTGEILSALSSVCFDSFSCGKQWCLVWRSFAGISAISLSSKAEPPTLQPFAVFRRSWCCCTSNATAGSLAAKRAHFFCFWINKWHRWIVKPMHANFGQMCTNGWSFIQCQYAKYTRDWRGISNLPFKFEFDIILKANGGAEVRHRINGICFKSTETFECCGNSSSNDGSPGT